MLFYRPFQCATGGPRFSTKTFFSMVLDSFFSHAFYTAGYPFLIELQLQQARLLVPLVPKDATLVQFTEKEGCTKAIRQSSALLEQVKNAFDTDRPGFSSISSVYAEHVRTLSQAKAIDFRTLKSRVVNLLTQ